MNALSPVLIGTVVRQGSIPIGFSEIIGEVGAGPPLHRMSPLKKYCFYIDAELADVLKRSKERDGVPESEQIRRAIAEWAGRKGLRVKEGKRPGSRAKTSNLR